ncbi:MAG: MBOAT family protein [Saprospiraceae bacterium]|nr:MBOAT family protein [Saprospiraceae bacterium]
MLFNSISFLVFFPIVTLLYYLLAFRFRWILLLLASCIFYMFFIPEYILIIFVTIIIDYLAGIYIENAEGHKKKMYLIVSIVSTCLVLIVFKYFNFFQQNIESLLQIFGFNFKATTFNILLPIGLSFHTFQSLSYVIEVYRGNQKAEKHFGIYSLYVMFYPQLVTGPIERPQNLLTQLRQEKVFEYQNLANGLRLMLFGFFVKMVIADNLGTYVDLVYTSPADFSSSSVRWATLFYSFQIYGDFFAYSTIAVGAALCMGYSLMDNFKSPYLSKSIGEFWSRWHISLSTWFRDYVYFSLGGNKVAISKWIFNILIVFAISGFWHGASWTFVIWGLAHGFIYILESFFPFNQEIKNKLTRVQLYLLDSILVLKTFVITSLIWILFRAQNLETAKTIFNSTLNNNMGTKNLEIDNKIFYFLGLFILIELLLYNKRFDKWCGARKVWVRWIIYLALIALTILYSSVQDYAFIYFQF